ncbi:hypothetical protein Ga0100230_007370 [Opitutaceae bacterium TAV3]|nr:hypothetical protein Ga0100230_007040 [Opitutaceae bacterium TAV3]RRK01648.1 hypothetical protein Ga0100230_007370 [Opitutaceae bacterium TAV3]
MSWTGTSAASSSVLWVRIQRNGGWAVHANGSASGSELASGTFSGFSNSATYTLGLTYDPVSGTASAFLTSSGGTTTTLLSSFDVSSLVNSSSITATGFRVNGRPADSVMIDNFSVTTTAIPEPRTAALVVGAIALGAMIMRHRARG